jgi:hypothetical protein
MNEKRKQLGTSKNEASEVTKPTRLQRLKEFGRSFGKAVGTGAVIATLAVGGLAKSGCSDTDGSATDAGNPCYELVDDQGVKQCLSRDETKCDWKLVEVTSSEAGVSDAGVTDAVAGDGAVTDGGLSDAGPTDGSVTDATAPEKRKVCAPLSDAEADAGLATDSEVVVPPGCEVDKAVRAFVALGKKWRVDGEYQCKENGDPSKVDVGDKLERQTENGFEECTTTVTEDTVTATCDSGTYTGTKDGCKKTTPEKVTPCEESDGIRVTGSTTFNKGLKSRAALGVRDVNGGSEELMYLQDDGKKVVSENVRWANDPVTAELEMLGQVGDDGSVVVAGKVDGPSGKSTCGTKVTPNGVDLGDVNVKVVGAQNDIRADSKFYADFEVGTDQGPKKLEKVEEGGPAIDVSGVPVNFVGSVVGGSSNVVKVEEASGQQRSCVMKEGLHSSEACNQMYNSTELQVTKVYHENSCKSEEANNSMEMPKLDPKAKGFGN